jgi:ribosome modulation factor
MCSSHFFLLFAKIAPAHMRKTRRNTHSLLYGYASPRHSRAPRPLLSTIYALGLTHVGARASTVRTVWRGVWVRSIAMVAHQRRTLSYDGDLSTLALRLQSRETGRGGTVAGRSHGMCTNRQPNQRAHARRAIKQGGEARRSLLPTTEPTRTRATRNQAGRRSTTELTGYSA